MKISAARFNFEKSRERGRGLQGVGLFIGNHFGSSFRSCSSHAFRVARWASVRVANRVDRNWHLTAVWEGVSVLPLASLSTRGTKVSAGGDKRDGNSYSGLKIPNQSCPLSLIWGRRARPLGASASRPQFFSEYMLVPLCFFFLKDGVSEEQRV